MFLDTIISAGKKAYDFAKGAVKVAYKIFEEIEKVTSEPPLSDQYKRYSRDMDVIAHDTVEPANVANDLARQRSDNKVIKLESALVRSLSEHEDFKYSITQKLELVRLGLEATSIDRHVQNLAIHSASLIVHLQTIRNITGITDDVSKISHSLNDAITTINQLSKIIEKSNPEEIDSIPPLKLNLKQEASSIAAACHDFENCRMLIERAAVELRKDIAKHQRDVTTVREEMLAAPAYGESIVEFLDNEIAPQLKIRANIASIVLRDIRDIPMLQLELPDDEFIKNKV